MHLKNIPYFSCERTDLYSQALKSKKPCHKMSFRCNFFCLKTMPGRLKVRVVAGRDLPVMDRASELTDAFVEVRKQHIVKSTVKLLKL